MPATATKTKNGARKAATAAATPRGRGALKAVALAPKAPTAPDGSGAAPTPSTTAAPTSRQGEGHGRRLTSAFEALEAFPALAESRNRLLALVGGHRVPLAEVVETVES